ncbi:threonine aspartase 1 [Hydra vulgaris]|uniref:Threonine aspartase 1 n=1 Tax=Hydra vulgaris TaxID=6087 RepID=T2M5Z2_HYDVU|nr:threonine aspartase 1-like [Hydra vulgaris]
MTQRCSGFVCLHIGAGYHSINKENLYINLCKKACMLGNKLLKEGNTCIDIVEKVCCFLEDSDLTNAGFGSNICQDGSIECEASIMESKSKRFSAVVCVKDLKNPIMLAKRLLCNQSDEHKLGLSPPMIWAGKGTKLKAVELGMKLIKNKSLRSMKAWEDFLSYQKNAQRLLGSRDTEDLHSEDSVTENGLEKLYTSKKKEDIKVGNQKDLQEKESERLDTVGVLCIDVYGEMASAVSSGGIAFKPPGRLGHTGQYGASCWAFQYSPCLKVASCTSGCGELLTQTNLAKSAADYSANNEILNFNSYLLNEFVHSQYISSSQMRLCGLLVAKFVNEDSDCFVDFHIAHTTDSFCIAFTTGEMKKPQVVMSRLNLKTKGPVSQGFLLKL